MDDRNARDAQWIDADFDRPERKVENGADLPTNGVSFHLRLWAMVAAILTCAGLAIVADSAFALAAVALVVAVSFVVIMAVVP